MPEFLEYLAEFRAGLTGDFVPSVEATHFLDFVKHDHPDVFVTWMQENAHRFVTAELSRMLRIERAHARRNAPGRVFAEAVAAHERGDIVITDIFQVTHVVDEKMTRRTVVDMTGNDHLYVADAYERTERRAAMEKAFHRAVARKVGDRTTGEVFTRDTYHRLYQSVVGTPPP